MLFLNIDEFKLALKKYEVHTRFPIKRTKATAKWVRARCEKFPQCKWYISGSYDERFNGFVVKAYQGVHNCNPTSKHRRITAEWLAENFFLKKAGVLYMKLVDMVTTARSELNLDLTIEKMTKVKKKVVKLLENQLDQEYAKLPAYVNEICKTNPRNTACLTVLEKIDELNANLVTQYQPQPIFDKIYFAFDAIKKGFLSGCRRVLGLDGSFLKGIVKGQVLAAVGRDANNQMYHVAWAVVEKESFENWAWFIQNLIEDLGIGFGYGWVIISDRHRVSGLVLFFFSVI